jgi:hypothetical protein
VGGLPAQRKSSVLTLRSPCFANGTHVLPLALAHRQGIQFTGTQDLNKKLLLGKFSHSDTNGGFKKSDLRKRAGYSGLHL